MITAVIMERSGDECSEDQSSDESVQSRDDR
jgi:hypothetical protein